ncbi:MAG: hypothetical protein FWG40_03350 [Peptococcaceae bacterium]|nr:hypothetical protein [Peptococcaceae bacterium]
MTLNPKMMGWSESLPKRIYIGGTACESSRITTLPPHDFSDCSSLDDKWTYCENEPIIEGFEMSVYDTLRRLGVRTL